jgi:hypothetical protein
MLIAWPIIWPQLRILLFWMKCPSEEQNYAEIPCGGEWLPRFTALVSVQPEKWIEGCKDSNNI